MGIDRKPRLPEIQGRRMKKPGEIFRVEQLDLEFANGQQRRYERLISKGVGAVIIVAMPDPDTVFLIREYACGVHRYEIGLPKGRLEPGESILEGANRELQEEVGFAAANLQEIGVLSLAPGYMSHVTHIVLARDLRESSLPGDEPEEIEVIPWAMDNLVELVRRPDCTEGRSIAALYIARDMIRNHAFN